jgi:signal transduction histidine kinase
VRGLFIAGIGALLSIFVLGPVIRSITRPLRKLAVLADSIGREPVQAPLAPQSEDEVGRLGRAFSQMTGRIERARQAERELIANLSHEIRTPITRTRMALALVDNGDPEVSRRIAAVETELRELQSFVEQILATAAVAGTTVELRPLLERCRDRLHTVVPQRLVELRVPESLCVCGDAALLGRLFDNLLDNARKYDSSSVPILVEAESIGTGVRVSVQDHGSGIPVDEREKVFQAFYRGPGARAASADGFGIGLSLARRIVTAHRGEIRIAGQSGPGTTVQVDLPSRANESATS